MTEAKTVTFKAVLGTPIDFQVPFGELANHLADNVDMGQALFLIRRLLNTAMGSCGATETILEWIYKECDDCEDRRCWAAVFADNDKANERLKKIIQNREILDAITPPALVADPGIMCDDCINVTCTGCEYDKSEGALSTKAEEAVDEMLSCLRKIGGLVGPTGIEHPSQSTLSETGQDGD